MSKYPVSPLAPASFPVMPSLAGAQIFCHATGMRYKGRLDLLTLYFPEGAEVAGVFTRSSTAAAPVGWCRGLLASGGRAKALVVNAGNANAFTGAPGSEAVLATARHAAHVFGCGEKDVFIASTGVIGQRLNPEPIAAALDALVGAEAGWKEAAEAIRTTDTFPKYATRQVEVGGRTVTINGISKGSGMIAPDMATMLGFVVTDAVIAPEVLQALLVETNERSFNAITVDSDTSTNDTLLLFATGEAGHARIASMDDPQLAVFREALQSLMTELAHLIIRDGEGATKFVTVKVTGAKDDASAKRIGLAVANSPLVKTAIAGEDANWGRIVAAIGKSGEPLAIDRIAIRIGEALVAVHGGLNPDYVEAPTAEYMKGQDIAFHIDAGVADGEATVWTCDLTHGYISINADYRS